MAGMRRVSLNMRKRLVWLAALVGAVVLVAASCGSDDGNTASAGEDSDGSVDPATVELRNVETGVTTNLAEATDPADGKPTLAFFWAPFCPSCRSEAPILDELAVAQGDKLNIVGIGTRDDLAYAEEFRESTGVENFPLLWEETGDSWVNFGVVSQPYLILLQGGREIKRWPGGAPEDLILAEIGKLS